MILLDKQQWTIEVSRHTQMVERVVYLHAKSRKRQINNIQYFRSVCVRHMAIGQCDDRATVYM